DAGGENDRKLIAPAVAAQVNLHGRPELAAAQASREAGKAATAGRAARAGENATSVMAPTLPCRWLGHGVRRLVERELRHRKGRHGRPARLDDRSARSELPGLDGRQADARRALAVLEPD